VWERKRAKARNAIQREALRLFADRGFAATTVEQVAEAADVAPSTVFRHFPTKQDLLVLDGYHPLLVPLREAFAAQPAERTALQALRGALAAVFAAMPDAERAARYERDVAMVTIPELWSANLGLVAKGMDAIADLVAERSGRAPDDARVRGLARVVSGACFAALLDWSRNPEGDPAQAIDEALSHITDPPPL
jgi:AcrR family transcriptional regulator